MKVLDLFSGAGGAAMGLHRAWPDAEIIGVDIVNQPRYPFRFVQADAMTFPLEGYDFIWASPPCQAHSVASIVHKNNGKIYQNFIPETRERLLASGLPFVIENVFGAPLKFPVILCGLMFGLPIFRHRLFECSWPMLFPRCSHKGKRIGEGYYSIAGGAGRWKSWGRIHKGVSKGTRVQWRDAMGIDWMLRRELTQAVPPAYSEFIARQFQK